MSPEDLAAKNLKAAETTVADLKAQKLQSAKQAKLNSLTPGGGPVKRTAGLLMSLKPDVLDEVLSVLAEIQKVK